MPARPVVATEDSRHLAPSMTWVRAVPQVAGAVALILAAGVLVGWAAGLDTLVSLVPGWTTLKANTAVAMGLLGIVLWRSPSARLSTVCTALVLAMSAATLVEWVTGLDLGFDQLLVRDPAGSPPGRMAAASAVGLLAIGAATLTTSRPRLSQALAIVGLILPYFAILGYAYDAHSLLTVGLGGSVSLPGAIELLILAAGALCLRPDQGWMRAITGPDIGGYLLRRLGPAAILVPSATGLLVRWSGWVPGVALAVSAVLDAVVFGTLLAATAGAARRAQTAQREAEGQVRKRERHLATTLDSIGDAVIATDAHGRVTRMNPVAETLTGWEASAAIGSPIARVFDVAADRVGPTVLRRRDGSLCPITDTQAPIRGDNGGIDGVVLVFRDQTTEREREARMRQSQKMEAVGRLAGGVAHDFNNMLSVILHYASFARQAQVPPEVAADLDEVIRAATTAAGLTRQLLAFSRHSVGTPRDVDVVALVADTERILARTLGEGIQVTVRAEQGPLLVHVDPDLMTQVLLNLCINARDAMPQGGSLTLGVERGSGGVEVSVADTGSGIPDEVRPHLFEPFYTTKERGKGTGLGLATSYGIISQAGGTLTADSSPAGATFRIVLPVVEGAARRTASTAPARARAGGETVLVAEDDEVVREVIRRALERAGYRLLLAGGVAEGLALSRTHEGRIDLLVSDGVMADGVGAALAEQLVIERPTIRILFVSGHPVEALGEFSERVSGSALLQKPFRPTDLIARVRAVLDEEPAQNDLA